MQLRPLDANVPIFQQLQADQADQAGEAGRSSPVVLVNIFQVAEAEVPAFRAAFGPHLFTRLSVSNICVGP